VDPRPADLFAAENGFTDVGMPYLQSLVDAARPGPRTKIAVVMPDTAAKRATSLRQTTYTLIAAGSAYPTEVRVLKVPPAVTDDFLALEQPDSEKAINNLIDAHGFNVAMPLDVELVAKTAGATPTVRIKSFGSNTQVRATRTNKTGEPPTSSFDDLAMVLVDYDHLAEKFDFEEHIFADTLSKNGWVIELEAEALRTPTELVLIDRYGNEERRVLQPGDFGTKP
jgi:hypothetical protein